MSDAADMVVKETAEELLAMINHRWDSPDQVIYSVESIPSEEAFGKPRIFVQIEALTRQRRKRRGPRPSDRAALARRCARCGGSNVGVSAPTSTSLVVSCVTGASICW